jgi:uncharacterized integral membrane protein (TIGR00698 family)
MNFVKRKGKGLLLCFAIAAPVWLAVKSVRSLEVIGAPVIAMAIGMLLGGILKDKSSLQEGISFTSKKILQYAVILLGFGMNLATIGKVGMTSLPIILSTISISLLTAFLLHKALKVPGRISILIGVGSSICGGSAIAATAPVIQADDEEIAQSISVIFLFNVIAAILFPALGSILGLSDNGFGLFAGTAINDTSSVTAAASTWDTLHGTGGAVLGYATIVKLTRTLAIIPITLVLSLLQIKKARQNQTNQATAISIKNIFPMFILYFILASIATTLLTGFCTGVVLSTVFTVFPYLNLLSKFLIVMAMGAIGLNTNLVRLVKRGGKPIALGFCCWMAIALVSLLLQSVLQIL